MANSMKDRTTDAVLNEQDRFPIYDILDLIEDNIELQMKGGEAMPIPTLCGRPGMSKTAHMKKIADALNLDLLYYSMCKPYENFTGLPDIHHDMIKNENTGDNNSYVYWSEPELIHEANRLARDNSKYRGCLVFLDDIHIMSPDVQKCFFELVLERRLGNYFLDKNVAITAAMNTSNMAGFDGFFSAINNRMQKFQVYTPFEYWYINCGAKLNPLVAAYLRYFQDSIEEEESIDSPFATFRIWSQLSELIQPTYERFLDDRNLQKFLYKTYILAKSLISGKNAIQLKQNFQQQIRYDYEGMVKNNAYKIDANDFFASLSFGNVVRYLRNDQDIDNLVKFITKYISNAENETIYENAILNIMYELLAFRNMYIGKTEPADKKKFEFYSKLQARLFNIDKEMNTNCIHKVIGKLNGVE